MTKRFTMAFLACALLAMSGSSPTILWAVERVAKGLESVYRIVCESVLLQGDRHAVTRSIK